VSFTLLNHSGRCLALNLPHAQVCSDHRCFCTAHPGRPPRRICGSLTLPSGQALTALPDALLEAAELRALVRRGDLEVHPSVSKPSAVEPSEPDIPALKPTRRKRGASR